VRHRIARCAAPYRGVRHRIEDEDPAVVEAYEKLAESLAK
jgi:hypothetical protein